MKNFSKTIAAIGMSLMTVGAFGQAFVHIPATSNRAYSTIKLSNAKQMTTLHQIKEHKTKAVQGVMQMDLAYFNLDYSLATTVYGQTWNYFSPPAYMNMNYSAADTGASSNKNYNGYHSAIVAFDTILDANFTPYTASSGSLSVDTIFVNLGYRNTSGTNDTLVFHIGHVAANGYPTGAFYTNDTVIVAPHSASLPGNVLDSVYEIYIIPNGGAGFTIPTGYKFNVTLEEYGSKLDTLGEFFGCPDFSCGGFGYALYTHIGPKMGVAPNVNSLMTGFQFYNTPHFNGNGSVLTWPNANGDLYNSNGSFGNIWNIPNCGAGEDTSYLYFQDIFTAVAITFNDNTGVSSVSKGNITVDQNYPNPFNQTTVINYGLTQASNVTFTVYDMTGRVVTTANYGTKAPGQYQVNLSANTFSPGVYFYTFNVNGSTVTKKMVITE